VSEKPSKVNLDDGRDDVLIVLPHQEVVALQHNVIGLPLHEDIAIEMM
jgi:hypothetical protein